MADEVEIHPKRAAILEQIEFQELEDILLADGHDHAILGLVDVGSGRVVVAYSTKKILEGLASDGMTWDEAREYFDFNIAGAYVGPGTPVYVQDDYDLSSEDAA